MDKYVDVNKEALIYLHIKNIQLLKNHGSQDVQWVNECNKFVSCLSLLNSIYFINNIKMQELTKLDINRLKSYNTEIDPFIISTPQQLYPHRQYPLGSYKQSHRQPTTSSVNDFPHTNFHNQHPVTLVQSISVPTNHHQRRSSCILSIRQIKQLQQPNSNATSRKSLQFKERKIYVSIAKSNCKQKQHIQSQIENDSKRKITLTKYIHFRSNQKAQQTC